MLLIGNIAISSAYSDNSSNDVRPENIHFFASGLENLLPQSSYLHGLSKLNHDINYQGYCFSYARTLKCRHLQLGIEAAYNQLMQDNFNTASGREFKSELNLYKIGPRIRYNVPLCFFLGFYSELSGGINYYSSSVEERAAGKSSYNDVTSNSDLIFNYGIGLGSYLELLQINKHTLGLDMGCRYTAGKPCSLKFYNSGKDNYIEKRHISSPQYLEYRICLLFAM